MKLITKALYASLIALLAVPTTHATTTKDLFAEKGRDRNAHYATEFLEHLNVSAGISTLGLTVEVATPIASHLKLRAGLNYFNYNSTGHNIDLEDNNGYFQQALGYTPNLDAGGKVNLFHGHALVDFYPAKKGIFFITAGLYAGKTSVKTTGELKDHLGNPVDLLNGQDWPTLDFEGNIISLNEGKLNEEIVLGNTIKPYVGIGLGRAVSKRRFGVKFELGVLYQGDYTITKHANTQPSGTEADLYVTDTEDYTKWLNWWPKVSLSLNYRIF
ncbi:hypothetical protein [Myroides pelagicus]|uniref:Outer membrane beta-barrel protein n=1 Tax=Myroides pelagicus TaxID=270914 RepID=A0A7K1GKF9_9FLAO|nr:hypothetical protein [Myroides pelagicus]MEC4112988.1 hypothetical protein [Myroides pelagicus]MTH29009.1 hypothetical protein [Myroides pelagicus]